MFNKKRYSKEWNKKNKDKVKQYNKTYRIKHKKRRMESDRKYKIKNKEKIDKNKQKYYRKNRKRFIEYSRNYAINNKEKIKEKGQKYNLNNKEKINKYAREYYINNRERLSILGKILGKKYRSKNVEKRRKRMREYYHKNINFRLGDNLRVRIRHALKSNSKSQRTMKLIGCSIQELKQHLEKQFTFGMNWKNHRLDGWHIDHIRPCASFDLSKPEEQQKCFHYTNLQPLWATENLRKNCIR